MTFVYIYSSWINEVVQGIHSSHSFVLFSTWYQSLGFKFEPKQEKKKIVPPQGFVLFPTLRRVGRVEAHPVTRLLLQHRRPPTVLPGHLPPLSDACNSDFQNMLSDSPVFLGFRAFLLDFFEIQRCFVDRRTKIYSNAVFSWKGGSFHCKILFFWYFSNF